jgi:cobalt-zinc-cadmium efflux system outer membrane protein
MHPRPFVPLWAAALLLAASVSSAQGPLSGGRVLKLAAEAPDVRRAETLVAEARGRLTGAGVWSERNPSLAADAGPRLGDRTSLEASLSLEIPVEPWGHRERRLAAARAEVSREEHAADDLRRRVGGQALSAFYRALHAGEAVQAAVEREALARELVAAAEERHRQGDTPLLHVKLASAELARAGSEARTLERHGVEARIVLAQVLGRPDLLATPLEGDLGDRARFDAALSRNGEKARPDLRVAAAEVAKVRAELALADLDRRPETALTLGYAREEGADVVTAGVSVALPLFNPRQGRREVLDARLQSARFAEESTRASAKVDVEGARQAYRAAVASLVSLEAEALPLHHENARLSEEAYRAGKLDLASVLLARREYLDARRAVLDRRLDACLAGLDFLVASAALHVFEPSVPEEGDANREGD